MKTLLIILLYSTFINVQASDWTKNLDKKKFEYTQISGIGHEKGCIRRDASDVIKVEDTYYVYYTKVFGHEEGYWGTIWCATSKDEGYSWTEQGEVLGVGQKGSFDSFGVLTPNIIYTNKKYYMYYTGVRPTPGKSDTVFENNSTNDYTALGVAVSDSPNGPFVRCSEEPVLRPSTNTSSFDSYRVDDASLIYKDKRYWMYYKGRSMSNGINGPAHTQMGVAFSDTPVGPFVKHKTPLLAKGHEVMVWPLDDIVYALSSISSTIENANDGLDFVSLPLNLKVKNRPNAPGAYRPDLTNRKDDKSGLNWGISMIHNGTEGYLLRFSYK